MSGAKVGSWISLFQLDVALLLATQLVPAVEYVHTQGIFHGDWSDGPRCFRLGLYVKVSKSIKDSTSNTVPFFFFFFLIQKI